MPCVHFKGSLNISAAVHASTETEDSCLILNACTKMCEERGAAWHMACNLDASNMQAIQATFMLCPGSIYQLRPAKHTLAPLSADYHSP